jgi:FkbM family methyltransferase
MATAERIRWRHVREIVSLLPRRASAKLLLLYATRSLAVGKISVATGKGRAYFHRRSIRSDWDSFLFIFLPRYSPYHADYRDALVIDIGAHKGYYALFALGAGARHVWSYEPGSDNFRALRRSASRTPNWDAIKAAVGAEDGVAELILSREPWAHSLVALPPDGLSGEQAGTETVRVIAIRDVLATPSGRLIVKINVEGAECDLLSAIADWSHVDTVFVDTHAWAACDPADLLEKQGFQVEHGRVLRGSRIEATELTRRPA